jgi:hypothetical protein
MNLYSLYVRGFRLVENFLDYKFPTGRNPRSEMSPVGNLTDN